MSNIQHRSFTHINNFIILHSVFDVRYFVFPKLSCNARQAGL